MKIGIELDSARAREAYAKAPEVMNRHLGIALDRGAVVVRGEADKKVSERDWTGKLGASIGITRVSDLERLIEPSANYARDVEYGTGPAAGKARYFPNFDNLTPYVKTHATRVEGEKLKKLGSKARFFQEQNFVNRAFQLARYIYAHGTKPFPYMRPTAEKMRSPVQALLRAGADRGVQEILG